MRKIKILTTFGTRPEVIKLAPFIKEVAADIDCIGSTCATTQHRELQYDELRLFSIQADYDLKIMRAGQDLFHITEGVLQGMKLVLQQESPDYVVVQGDTTTAFAAALTAFYQRIPVVHIEAGLRTNNLYNPYPEEANRQLIARIATLHMAPTNLAVQNLKAEGITKHVYQAGNTIVDALPLVLQNRQLDSSKQVLITVHRRENFGCNLQDICFAISELTKIYQNYTFVWPVHPNPNIKEFVYANMNNIDNLVLSGPKSYEEMVELISTSAVLLSDSGGIQEEACILGKPIVILRNETERPEVISAGYGILAGSDQNKIINAMHTLLDKTRSVSEANVYGAPGVSKRIIQLIKEHFCHE